MIRPFAFVLSLLAGMGSVLGGQKSPNAGYEALLAIHRCARDYIWGTDARLEPTMHRAHPEFPRDLTQLGPAGTRCLDETWSRGGAGSWRVEYKPLIDAQGRATGYELRASDVATSHNAALELYSVVHSSEASAADPVDRDAIVHVRSDGRAAAESDSVYGSPLPNIRRLVACMRTPNDPKHSWVLELEQVKGCVPSTTFDIKADTDFAGRSTARTWGPGFDYTIVYSPVWVPGACDDPGEECGRGIADIILDVRPTTYGVTGIRSYYINDGGVVSADWENPETIPTGRAFPLCEIWNGTMCSTPVKWPRLNRR